jgi:Domain of unknown function (DUF4145)
MLKMLVDQFDIDNCPLCGISHPNMHKQYGPIQTHDRNGGTHRIWKIYQCSTCGGFINAWSDRDGGAVEAFYPFVKSLDNSIPEKPREILSQAMRSLHAPSGAVMLSASAIDAMLKVKSYTSGSLYARIDKAAADHLITVEMASWAHDVRLDANDERHAEETEPLPDMAEAKRAIEFTQALAEYLFVLPARVTRGRAPVVAAT